jgi:hypothetical protein
VYPGIDVVFHGNGRRLEFDFVTAPGANPKLIRMQMKGQEKLSVKNDGSLNVHLADGDMTFQAPTVYEEDVHGERAQISGGFVIVGKNEVAFAIGAYDHSRTLVIDPVLAYSTYVAGSGTEVVSGIATDQSGAVYVTGTTTSVDFPTRLPLQSQCGSASPCAATFLTKLNSAGQVVFSTYIGGDGGGNYSTGIAVDPQGNVIISGTAGSPDFPTVNSYTTYSGGNNIYAFVLSISPDGSHLNYSTLLGRLLPSSVAVSVAVDQFGSAYVAGQTIDDHFPVTSGVLGTSFPFYPWQSLFITKLGSDGSLVYSTPVPGPNLPFQVNVNNFNPKGIAVDSTGAAYIGGQAGIGLPTTPGVISPNIPGDPGGQYGFVLKLNPTASALLYASYLPETMAVTAIAPDPNGGVYVGGVTVEVMPGDAGFGATPGAFQNHIPPGKDCTCNAGFVAHLNSQASAYLAATYLTGTPAPSNEGTDILSMALDASGAVWVGGITGSSDFPLKNPIVGGFPPTSGAGFVTEMSADLTSVSFSTFLDGLNGFSPVYNLYLAAMQQGVFWTAGTTYDTDFPTTSASFQEQLPTVQPGIFSFRHAFVSKVDATVPAASACLSTTGLNFPATVVDQSSGPKSVSVTNCGNAVLHVQNVTVSGGYYSQTNTCNPSVAIGATCSVNFTFSPLGVDFSQASATALIVDDASYSPQRIYLAGTSEADFALASVSSNSATATVKAGQTATYALSVTGKTAYNGTVVINCLQVPLNYTCNISNSFLQIQPGVTTSFVVNVAPASSSATFAPWKWPPPAAAVIVLAILALLTIPGTIRKMPSARYAAPLLLFAMLCGAVVEIGGCGGGGGSSSASSGAIAQTYTLQIVASGISTNHSLPITLVIEK